MKSLLGIPFVAIMCLSCSTQKSDYQIVTEKIAPNFLLKSTPKEGDWLFTRKVNYQTFDEYIKSKPTSIDSVRNKIYIMLFEYVFHQNRC